MTARIASSAVTSAAAPAISAWTCALSAFIFGLSSRIVAMPSATSTRTNSPKPATSTSSPPANVAAHLSYSAPLAAVASGGPDADRLAEVAVGHAHRRVRVRDQAEFGAADQQRMLGQHPHGVAERSRPAEFHLTGEPGQRSSLAIVCRLGVGSQRDVARLDDLVVLAGPAVNHLDRHIGLGKPAERGGHPHGQHRTKVRLGAVRLDMV